MCHSERGTINMGAHNHHLQRGDNVYLGIVARYPDGIDPKRARWFGSIPLAQASKDWDQGCRLRGWVTTTHSIETLVAQHPEFGEVIPLPFMALAFAFVMPVHRSLWTVAAL